MKRRILHNHIIQSQTGVLMVEIIVTMAIFALLATGAIYFLSSNVYSAQAAAKRATAAAYLQQGVEAVQAIDREAWNFLADTPDAEYGLDQTSGIWSLAADPDNPDGDPDYTRTITVADVYRNPDGDIVESTETDATLDPHTRSVNVEIEWDNGPMRTSDINSMVAVTDWDASEYLDNLTTDFSAGTLNNLRISEIDDGELQIIQAPMEVGTVTATSSWATITLDNEYTNPVVVTSVLDGNNPNSPVSSRVKDTFSTSFDIRLDFPTDNYGTPTTNSETVYYMVIEAGIWTLGDGATQIEAGIVKTVSDLNCSTCGTWNRGTDMDYDLTYTSAPLVFHQIVSENDNTWITSFVSDDTSPGKPPGTDGFQLALNGAESTTSHAAEDIAYVVVEREVEDAFEGINYETDATGDVVLGYTNTHHSETLDQTYGSAPWAIVTQQTMDGANGGWSMLDSITSSSITMYVDEDQTLDSDRAHISEDFGYWVMAEEGTYYLNQAQGSYDYPKMEVGVIESTETGSLEVGTATADTSWTTIPLSNTYTKPVVNVTILDGNNPNSPVSARVKDTTASSFDVRLDFPTDNYAPVTTNSETIYYMVVEAGVWEIGDSDVKIEADVVEDVSSLGCSIISASCAWPIGEVITYTHAYSSAPLVFHQVMSENDSSWVTSWVSDDSIRSTPPQTDAFQIALNGAQVTSSHSAEDIGYIVIEKEETGTADSITFETDATGDVVAGYSNPHTTESFDNVYSSSPLALVTQMSMDGADGGWAMLDGTTATTITMYEDEDQAHDSERFHTTDDFGYISFDQAGVLTLQDWDFLGSPYTVNLQNTYTNPVVITTPLATNNFNSPFSTRVYDVQSDEFTIRMDFPQDRFGISNTAYSEPVYYMVMEEGQWQMGSTKVEAHVQENVSTVANSSSWIGDSVTYDHSYSDNPLVLHQVMSSNDNDWITSWVSQNGSRTAPPNTSGMNIALNAAQVTTSNAHAAEDIGWIAFEDNGTDTYESVEFRTEHGNEAIYGYDDGCYSYTHGGTYSEPIVLAAQTTMDGADGSWIAMCSLDSTSVGLTAEEDQYSDSERSHTSEDYALIIFEDLFDTAGDDNTGAYESDVIDISASGRNFNIIEWAEQTDCENCDVTVQVRTATSSAGLSSETYVGPDGTNATSFEDPEGDLLYIDHIGDTFMQYYMILDGTTAESPIVEDVTISYYEE